MSTPPPGSGTLLQFTPFSSLVQPTFWHELTTLKIDVLRLEQNELPVRGTYSPGRSVFDRETGKEVDLGCHLTLGGDAFKKNTNIPFHTVSCTGTFKNFNTVEDFKNADKTALFNKVADQIWDSIDANGDLSALNRFLLITFADLKKYKYYYWFAFPALVAKPAWTLVHSSANIRSGTEGPVWSSAETIIKADTLRNIYTKLDSQTKQGNFISAYFLVRYSSASEDVAIAPLSDYLSFFSPEPKENELQLVCFIDPSASPNNPGWPLRNALAYIHHQFTRVRPNTSKLTLNVLCWRDFELPRHGHKWQSRVGAVSIPLNTAPSGAGYLGGRPSFVGWEKLPSGKLGPRLADLAPMMDPTLLASQAVDLNLKLMRWRILPSLELSTISSTKCLLLGAGTLGCYVARVLMGWGVRKLTFVDSGRVAFSNPVRQPLFDFIDCIEGENGQGKGKASCAAEAVKRIFPGVESLGVTLSIPMPGHPIPPSSVEQVGKDIRKLEDLIEEHDAIFLLMDSRESRWLPSVIGKTKGKIVMNAALGFDSYLVMRHGARHQDHKTSELGCYYCNDVVAPTDSLTDRTLDQMCTVTRPGLAAIASATLVELLVSILQHPNRDLAPAPPPNFENLPESSNTETEDGRAYKSVLGVVPHQLRGFLAQFKTLPIRGAAYNRCTACSETVLQAYEKEGFSMLLRAFNEPAYLEKLTGLDKLQAESEAILESVDWEEEDEL